jgi:tRNA(Ile)-lysidine synthase
VSGPGPLPAGQDRDALLAVVATDVADLAEGARVVVALSGGPDSTALAYLLTEARPDLEVTLVHVRHGLRDDADDVAVVERHAAYLGVPLEVVEVTVERDGRGPQASARDARYDALRAVAAARGADAIVVGHTADDQAETVLLRAARGTGPAGLAAMRRRSGDLLRPLLRLRRVDLRRFVVLEGLPVATDPSNADVRVPRVAVRDRLLPLLGEVGPDPVGALGRLAALAADDDDALTRLAGAAVARHAVRCGDVVAVRDADVAALPTAVLRRVWRQLLAEADPDRPPPPASTVVDLLALTPGRRARVGHLEIAAGGGWRALAPVAAPRSDPQPIAVPGVTPWVPADVQVRAVVPGDPDDGAHAADRQIAFAIAGAWTPPPPARRSLAPPPGGDPARCVLVLPAEAVPTSAGEDDGRLRLRHRRPGDRIRTGGGTRRVADVLVDARVPRPVRERWPVLVTGDDRVVWIPGIEVDAALRTAGRAEPALQLVVTRRAHH